MKKPTSAREPIQVYLDDTERSWLDEIADREGVSRSEVLRRSVRQYRAARTATESPMLRLLDEARLEQSAVGDLSDIARGHDDELAAAYAYPAPPSPTARRRPAR